MARNNLELASSYIESHIVEAARDLEMHSPSSAAALLLAIPLNQAQRLITQMLPIYAAAILKALDSEDAAALLGGSNPNQIAAILRHHSVHQRKNLLKLLPNRLAARTKRLIIHPQTVVGAWMKFDLVMLPGKLTSVEALQRIRESGSVGDGDAIPVLSDSQQPIGYIGIAALLAARSEVPVSQLFHPGDAAVISSGTSLLVADKHTDWNIRDNLIVVNSRGHAEGMLRHCDLRSAIQLTPGGSPPVTSDSFLTGLSQVYPGTMASLLSLVSGAQPVQSSNTEYVQETSQ